MINFDLKTLADLGLKTLNVMKKDAMLNEIYGLHLDLLISLSKLDLSCLIPHLEQVFKGTPVYANFEECMKQFQAVTNDKDLIDSLTKQLNGSSTDFVSWFILHFMHVFADNYARTQTTKVKEIPTLTENEKDVAVYLSGFVINKLTKNYYNIVRKSKSSQTSDKILTDINRLHKLIKPEGMATHNTRSL